jgi:hypothetical protein
MKTIKRPYGTEQPYFTDIEIDRIAVEELLGVGLLPSKPEPVRIERFVEKRFGLAQVFYEDLPATVLGYTQFSAKGVEAVLVSRALSEEGSRVAERRINSTLAHEAGHGLLHGYLFMLDSFPPGLFENDKDVTPSRILCRDDPTVSKRPTYDGRWWEYQANRMIGALLLPKPLVLAAIGPQLVPSGHLGALTLPSSHRGKIARELAELFDVNTPVAEIRLATLCPLGNVDQLTL